jgi:hypothetical protein
MDTRRDARFKRLDYSDHEPPLIARSQTFSAKRNQTASARPSLKRLGLRAARRDVGVQCYMPPRLRCPRRTDR